MVMGDTHIPYDDKGATDAALGFLDANKSKIDRLVLTGDMIDCYTVSSWLKLQKKRLPNFQEEIDATADLLARIRKIYKKKIYYLEGNHEYRLTRYVMEKAAALGSLRGLTIPSLLGLKELKIQWVPRDEVLTIGGVTYMHGDQGSKSTTRFCRSLVDNCLVDTIAGHCHRPDFAFRRTFRGSVRAWSIPCLCSLSPEFISGVANWAHGFILVHPLDKRYKKFHVETVMIENGRVMR